MDAFAWPIAALIFAITALCLLRSPLTRLLDRAKSIGPSGLKAREEASIQSSAQPNTPINDLLKQFDSPLLVEAETAIERGLAEAKLSAGDRERLLIRHLAQAQLNANFERDYNLCFGSQLIALELLNERGTSGDSVAWIERFYKDAAAREPEFYGSYSFDQWIGFLKIIQAVEIHGDGVTITVYGREFLKYVVGRGLTLTKRG